MNVLTNGEGFSSCLPIWSRVYVILRHVQDCQQWREDSEIDIGKWEMN